MTTDLITLPSPQLSATPGTSGAAAAPEPLRFHRLARTRRGWWRPLVMLVTAAVSYVLVLAAVLFSVAMAGLASPRIERVADSAFADEQGSMEDPAQAVVMLGMLALMVPACQLAARVAGRRGQLSSVDGRFRWGLFARALVPSLLVLGTFIGVSVAVAPAHLPRNPQLWTMLAVIVVLVPVQAAGEEFVFRGLLPQVVGAWLRSPVWGVLISLPLFVAGHEYNAVGLAGTGTFAAGAAWLVWRTGGLEAAIAWHAVNNVLVFTATNLGLLEDTTEITVTGAAFDIASTLCVVAAMEWCWRSRWAARYRATRQDAETSSR